MTKNFILILITSISFLLLIELNLYPDTPALTKIAEIAEYNQKIFQDENSAKNIIINYEKTFARLTPQDYQNARKTDNNKLKFCIVSAAGDNEKYATESLKSVFMQDYHNWHMVYVNTKANEKFAQTVKNNLDSDKFILSPKESKSDVAVYYQMANDFCLDDEVMVFLNDDVFFIDSKVLSKLAAIYESDKIWMTYGAWVASSRGFMAINPIKNDNTRNYGYLGQLCTSYSWLFKKINANDLKINGQFFNAGGDLAWKYPMLEMAGEQRVKFIEDITYIFHYKSNYDYEIDYLAEKIANEKYIKAMPKYNPIK